MKKSLFLSAFILGSHLLFAQWTNSSPLIIPITTPNRSGLFIQGQTGAGGSMTYEANGGTAIYWITSSNDNYFKIGGNGGSEPATGALNIDPNGHVGLNTMNTSGYNFSVAGTAVFQQVTVKATVSRNNPSQTPWADYVFQKDYRLRPLGELGEFIRQHNHLPGIPTADQVAKDGIDLAATQAKLLEKIEELTLYTLELKKEMDALKAENQKLAARRHK
jgi:hypothetical protein